MSWFENIGKKIKGLAIVIFFLTILFGIIGAISTWIDFLDINKGLYGLFIALLIILTTVLVAYLSVIMLYAVGELVDTNMQLRDDVSNIKFQLNRIANSVAETPPIDRRAQYQQKTNSTPAQQPSNNVEPVKSVSPIESSRKPIPFENNSDLIICPQCGKKQFADRTICSSCGCVFEQ